jgi:hypothetical protein
MTLSRRDVSTRDASKAGPGQATKPTQLSARYSLPNEVISRAFIGADVTAVTARDPSPCCVHGPQVERQNPIRQAIDRYLNVTCQEAEFAAGLDRPDDGTPKSAAPARCPTPSETVKPPVRVPSWAELHCI